MSEVQIVKSFLEELSKTPRNHPDSIPIEKIDETAISITIPAPLVEFQGNLALFEEKKVHVVAKTVRPPIQQASTEINVQSTILELKEVLASQLSTQPSSIRLMYKGKPLVNSRLLDDYVDADSVSEVNLQMFLMNIS
ncbi:ubiquitin family protein, Get5 candidate [Schizosaccharomyces pombe]|uniref:Uncharacterized ubiquitin-like protein C800.12c n=1 Tax=Schizosaccharomyces pombe (strain 972 / ATCC 24843) TaxID=284812 RepID=YHLC_SCHPO|nr:putative ubiquitin family protein [Schizosaccharomyces pombe]Q9HGL0.1 RecName: Full=Uncharacterized ubiquitin-like protein C800.12c [Schizosaccharomyces pombe 972h-]CAC01527.1 ubiquitin family protein (predicted) [Schizosaccharomyces pombe]|eukprot:NP_001342970.1 putative ubiquitin family protein [Schizosaccharomyces pombe]